MKTIKTTFKILALALLISSVQQSNMQAMNCARQYIFSSIRNAPQNIAYAWNSEHIKQFVLFSLGLTATGAAIFLGGDQVEDTTTSLCLKIIGGGLAATGTIFTATCICVCTPVQRAGFDALMQARREVASGYVEQ